MARGLFIAFEGIDGSGKSSQVKPLKSYLEEQHNLRVVTTYEPYQYERVKARIRNLPSVSSDPEGMAKLFIDDRILHIQKVIQPALEGGEVVISDRYGLSTICYQSAQALLAGRDLSIQQLIEMQKGRIIQPDITFFINTSLVVAEERIMQSERKNQDEFDRNKEFRRVVFGQYQKCIELAGQDPSVD